MSKQQPEESLKDKIMKSMGNGETDKKEPAKGTRPTAAKSTEKKESRDRLTVSNESVGARRSRGTAESAKAQPVKEAPKSKRKTQPDIKKAPATGGKKPSTGKQQKTAEINRRRNMRQKEDKLVSKIVTIVVLSLLVIGGILGFFVYRYVDSSLKPLDSHDSKKVEVVIPSGSSNKGIGEILEKDNVIKSGMIFNYYTKFNNLTGFQAGNYQFSPDMTLEEISKVLQQGGIGTAGADAKVTIPEGFDVEQIGDKIAEATGIKKDDFIALMKDESFFAELHKKYPELLDSAATAEGVRYRLEGYLFPATYDYYKGMALKDIVTEMVNKSNSVLSPYFETIKGKNMTVQQVLTLASLVEKEGETETDRRKIAQVFFNRLAVNMPLQSDISILYALGEHKELVTIEDTQIDSPYNLYVNTGYGPGPFDNPSEQSIKAVLDPIANNYYYFVADIQEKKVYYAETYEQHMELVEEHVNN